MRAGADTLQVGVDPVEQLLHPLFQGVGQPGGRITPAGRPG
jgi:hypothetical protein